MNLTENKTVEFLFQERAVHFLINPTDKNVMVNATEMAKMFGKRTDHYLQNEVTKSLIEELERTLIGVRSENERTGKSVNSEIKVPDMSGTLEQKVVDNRGRNGVYFCELLALDFATWLDVKFKVWVYQTIRDLLTQETKQVKTALNSLATKETALEKIVNQVKASNNTEAMSLLSALSEYETAKKNKTKAFTIFSKQMQMDI